MDLNNRKMEKHPPSLGGTIINSYIIITVENYWVISLKGYLISNTSHAHVVALSEKKQVQYSMAIGNVELMYMCFPKHSCMRTARMK